jgi:demethylmenaquinone methyltransferase/2-methoxy-6-polyprenyl-1,4-benzoquinol methylase
MVPDKRLYELQEFFDRSASEWAVRSFDFSLMESLIDRIGLLPSDRVLDLGGGTGHLLSTLRKRIGEQGMVCMVDLSPEMLRQAATPAARTRAMRCCGLVENLPLKDGQWDAVVCMGLFPHLIDRQRALAEIRRALVPSGRMAILHLIGREKLNVLHQEIGRAVADNLLPPGEKVAQMLVEAGFQVEEVLDREDCFEVTGKRL